MNYRTSLLFVVLALLSGCATIFTGTYDDITITTTPPGATVLIDGIEWGRTLLPFRISAME